MIPIIRELLKEWKAFAKENPELVVNIAKLGALMLTLSGGLKGAAIALGPVIKLTGALSKGMAALVGPSMTGAIGVFVAEIGLLAWALLDLGKSWGKLKEEAARAENMKVIDAARGAQIAKDMTNDLAQATQNMAQASDDLTESLDEQTASWEDLAKSIKTAEQNTEEYNKKLAEEKLLEETPALASDREIQMMFNRMRLAAERPTRPEFEEGYDVSREENARMAREARRASIGRALAGTFGLQTLRGGGGSPTERKLTKIGDESKKHTGYLKKIEKNTARGGRFT